MKKTLAAMLLASAALTGAAQAQGSGNVNLAYVEWSDAIVATNILAHVLEDQGYTVSMTPLPTLKPLPPKILFLLLCLFLGLFPYFLHLA